MMQIDENALPPSNPVFRSAKIALCVFGAIAFSSMFIRERGDADPSLLGMSTTFILMAMCAWKAAWLGYVADNPAFARYGAKLADELYCLAVMIGMSWIAGLALIEYPPLFALSAAAIALVHAYLGLPPLARRIAGRLRSDQ